MIPLARCSEDDQRPFANLLPLVDVLCQGGNALDGDGFVLNPDGWRFWFARPLDLARIRERFEVPDSIRLSPEHDMILDRLTWCSIEGPGAHPGP